MTEIQQGRYDALLRRVADLKGPGSKVSDALGELFPTIDVENVPGELLLLAGTRLGMGSVSLAASAGNFGKAQIFNPVGSGLIVTVTTVSWSRGTAGTIRMANNHAELSTLVSDTNLLRDTRVGTGSVAASELRSDFDPTQIDAVIQMKHTGDVTLILTEPNGLAVLGPGTGFTIAPDSLNVDFLCSFWWRERVAEPSELSF